MKKSFAALGKIVNALECAYAAGWRAMHIAKKLKNAVQRKACRSRIMGRINKIRGELKRYSRLNWSLFDTVPYQGVVVYLIAAPVIHTRFVRAV